MNSAELKNSLTTKPLESYSEQVKGTLKLVAYHDREVDNFLVGSYTYRSQKYPADFDIMDKVSEVKEEGKWVTAKDPNTLSEQVAKRLRKICLDVDDSKNTHFVEMKAGFNYDILRYLFPMGALIRGDFILSLDFIDAIENMPKAFPKMKSQPRNMSLWNIIRFQIQEKDKDPERAYYTITNILRSWYVLRWSMAEILRGEKDMTNAISDQKITLEMALFQPAIFSTISLPIVKIDLVKLVDGVFVDVSSIYMLEWSSDVMDGTIMSMLPGMDDLTLDVEKLAFSKIEASMFKCLKRVYAYARSKVLYGNKKSKKHYAQFIPELTKFLSGDVALLYQAKNFLQAIVTLYDLKVISRTQKTANHQIDTCKNLISNSLVLTIPEAKDMCSKIDAILSQGRLPEKKKLLNALIKDLSYKCDVLAYYWAQSVGWDPIPDDFLPTKKSIRDLNDDNLKYNALVHTQPLRSYNPSHNINPDTIYGIVPEAPKKKVKVKQISPESVIYKKIQDKRDVKNAAFKKSQAERKIVRAQAKASRKVARDKKRAEAQNLKVVEAPKAVIVNPDISQKSKKVPKKKIVVDNPPPQSKDSTSTKKVVLLHVPSKSKPTKVVVHVPSQVSEVVVEEEERIPKSFSKKTQAQLKAELELRKEELKALEKSTSKMNVGKVSSGTSRLEISDIILMEKPEDTLVQPVESKKPKRRKKL